MQDHYSETGCQNRNTQKSKGKLPSWQRRKAIPTKFLSFGDGFLYQEFLSFSKVQLSKCRNQDCYRACSGFNLENKTQRSKSQTPMERKLKVDKNVKMEVIL